jgi:multimeric flavodoxin WrbA
MSFNTSGQRVVVLDGTRSGEDISQSVLSVLRDVLAQDGAHAEVISLADAKLAHCIGCFACWVETPGLCRYQEADFTAILNAVVQSHTTVLVTPITFGGYSARVKQIMDRFVSLVMPYLQIHNGEVHHVARYARLPRMVGIGLQNSADPDEARLFQLLVGRNAINFQAPAYAAAVVTASDSPDEIRTRLRSLFTRNDPFPSAAEIRPLVPVPDCVTVSSATRRACLIVGSPKTLKPSTSGVLGRYLLKRLEASGWQTESLVLNRQLVDEHGQSELFAAVDRADLLILAFPLYVDALPFLLTRALELIADHRHAAERPRIQRLVALANNGFPEAYQNNLALWLCERFASATGMIWSGGLALGGGEGLIGGYPLEPRLRSGLSGRHVIRALDLAAAALAHGQPVPGEAVREMSRNPARLTPEFVWRRLFVYMSRGWWNRQAAAHGLKPGLLHARPYPRSLVVAPAATDSPGRR